MAIKGYSKGRSIKALDALTGGPIPKRYFIVNIGIRQLANVKEMSLLLRKEETLDFRIIPIRMHSSECNWKMIRSLLGRDNPEENKHLAALDKLKNKMADTGGIIIKERRITREDKGKTSNVFEMVHVELFDATDHPGISAFSEYTKLQLGLIKPLLEVPEDEEDLSDVTDSLDEPSDSIIKMLEEAQRSICASHEQEDELEMPVG